MPDALYLALATAIVSVDIALFLEAIALLDYLIKQKKNRRKENDKDRER
jgi:hypothetical protein